MGWVMLTDASTAIAYIDKWRTMDRIEAARELLNVVYEECVNQINSIETVMVKAAQTEQVDHEPW